MRRAIDEKFARRFWPNGASDPPAVAAALVRRIREIDPPMTIFDVRTMLERMGDSLARQRFSTLMLGAFAAFALILAIVGVYGVMSHLVAQGAHDIGVRMALGAERWHIVWMVVRQGLELTVAGVVLGLAGALALTRVTASLLFAVALVASFIPARRATRVDPVVALRDE